MDSRLHDERFAQRVGGGLAPRPRFTASAWGWLAVWLVTMIRTSSPAQDNWPQFRGPYGDGSSKATNLPLIWSESNGVRWATAIHGKGWSSPVIWGSQIWMTTATEDGTRLFAVCVERETGKVLHDLKVFDVDAPQSIHKFNSPASPTPVIEEGRVYVTFGSPGTACLDTRTGKTLWQRRDFVCNHYRGAGSSPILHGDLLLMHFDGSDHQYVVALNKHTGETVWRRNRSIDFKDLTPEGKPAIDGDLRKAFATPHVAVFDGRPVFISQGAKAHYSYDPLTGEEFWRLEERIDHSASGRPVVANGMIFITCGFGRGLVLAIKPGPKGQVSDTNIVWRTMRNAPNKPSLIVSGDLLFMVDDGGVASCVEAATGKECWRERVGGNHSASPLLAEGRIYFCNEEGKTTVVAAERAFKKLADNQLGDGFMASPAVAGSNLILRSRTRLYSIGSGK
jgi:outer membrane protein assembly factor BamB